MSPLRFRAWWSGLKKMMTDFRIAADGRVFSAAGNELFIPSDVVVMQSTGLRDRNGVEIFEGDIVTAKSHGYTGTFEIRWREDGGAARMFILFPAWQNREMWYLASSRERDGVCYDRGVEVIGNVHANTEPLAPPLR